MNHDQHMKDTTLLELTDAAEREETNTLNNYLQALKQPEERINVLKQIGEINREKRYKRGTVPMLMFVHERLDGGRIDFALLKKSSDWLFADTVLYKETTEAKQALLAAV